MHKHALKDTRHIIHETQLKYHISSIESDHSCFSFVLTLLNYILRFYHNIILYMYRIYSKVRRNDYKCLYLFQCLVFPSKTMNLTHHY